MQHQKLKEQRERIMKFKKTKSFRATKSMSNTELES
jgi:hypothetical protein